MPTSNGDENFPAVPFEYTEGMTFCELERLLSDESRREAIVEHTSAWETIAYKAGKLIGDIGRMNTGLAPGGFFVPEPRRQEIDPNNDLT